MNKKPDPEFTTKHQKEAYLYATESSLNHLISELNRDIQAGIKAHPDNISRAEILADELREAKSQFDELGLDIQNPAKRGRMNFQCIDLDAYNKIMNAEPGTYHNIYKWIDAESRPELDQVFKGWVLFKYIKYLEGEISGENKSDPTLDKIIKIATEGNKIQKQNKKHAKEFMKGYSTIKNQYPCMSIESLIEEIGMTKLSNNTYREWIEKYDKAEKMLSNDH